MLGIGSEAQTNIKAVITADDQASRVLKNFGDSVHGFGNVIEKGLKTAAVGLAAAGAAATAFGVSSVKAFTESQDMIAQTNAVLKSTAGIAGVTADEVTKLSAALQKQTRFSDEEVRSAENLLLTFTSIGKDIFPKATETVLDMATALGEDTKSASIQLGKALQDPVLGITALRRVGVNFSDKQKDVIQSLVDTNQKAEAQKLILKELQTEFGGSAKAAGDTFAGSLDKLKNSLNDVQEQVGKVIVEKLSPFVTKALEAVASIDWGKVIDTTISHLRDFRDWLEKAGEKIGEVAQKVGDYLMPKLDALFHTFQDSVLPVLLRLWHEVIEPLIPVLGTALVVAIGLVIDALNLFFAVISPIIDWMLNNKGVVIGLATAFGLLALAMKFDAIVAAFSGQMDLVIAKVAATQASLSGIVGFLGGAVAAAGWATFAAVGIAAFVMIQNKANETKAVLDRVNSDIMADSNSITAGLQQIKDLADSGKITHAKAAQLMNQLSVGHKASGGAVTAGSPYIVGEEGRELFVPDQPGRIVPSPRVHDTPGGGVNVVVNIGLYAGSEQEKRKVAMELMKSLKDVASSKGKSVGDILGIA
jgi:hypothetical protein